MYPPYFYVSIKLDTTASGACTLVSYAMRSYAAGLPCFDLRLQRAGPRKKAQSVTHRDALPANERH